MIKHYFLCFECDKNLGFQVISKDEILINYNPNGKFHNIII